MKNSIVVIFSILFLLGCSAPKENESSETAKSEELDLSTDEAVFNDVVKNRNENYSELKKEDLCIVRSEIFKDLILIGYQDKSRCLSGEIYYKNKLYTDNSFSQELMIENGWEEESKREKLLLDWITVVSARWQTVLFEKPKYFDTSGKYEFHSPKIEILDNGEKYEVSVWINEELAPDGKISYLKLRTVFLNDGTWFESKNSQQFILDTSDMSINPIPDNY